MKSSAWRSMQADLCWQRVVVTKPFGFGNVRHHLFITKQRVFKCYCCYFVKNIVYGVCDETVVDDEFECVSVCHGHSQDVKSVVWHPTDELLVSTAYDDTIRA